MMADFSIEVTVDDEDYLRAIGNAALDWSESCSRSTVGELVRQALSDEINSLTEESVDLNVEVDDGSWAEFLDDVKAHASRTFDVTISLTVEVTATDESEAVNAVMEDPYGYLVDVFNVIQLADMEATEQ